MLFARDDDPDRIVELRRRTSELQIPRLRPVPALCAGNTKTHRTPLGMTRGSGFAVGIKRRLSSSVMARRAIEQRLALRLAGKAIAHIEIHSSHRRGLLQHIAMAARTGHARADVRGMIEPDVSRGAVVIDAYQGNIFATSLISCHFPDFGPVFGDYQMAAHAELHAGDGGFGSLIHSVVAGLALQSSGEMHLVREGDGLGRLSRMAVQEIADSAPHGGVRGGEDALRLLRRAGCSRGRSRA
jgi:hypothetical protein